MTFREWLNGFETTYGSRSGLRRGQAYFNYLYDHRPELADLARASPWDPFFQDKNIPEFLVWVMVNW